MERRLRREERGNLGDRRNERVEEKDRKIAGLERRRRGRQCWAKSGSGRSRSGVWACALT